MPATLYTDPERQEPDEDGENHNPDPKEIMNWERLIGRLGDEELILQVVPIFLKDNKERIDKLEKRLDTGLKDIKTEIKEAIKEGFEECRKIMPLTCPNGKGKITIAQAIGLCSVLTGVVIFLIKSGLLK